MCAVFLVKIPSNSDVQYLRGVGGGGGFCHAGQQTLFGWVGERVGWEIGVGDPKYVSLKPSLTTLPDVCMCAYVCVKG